ncbi:MAG: hypothetical protein RLZZ148_1114, partial [Cyanobacteriota bacterium]
ILQFASLSFDASSWEIVMAFGVGATLYLGTKESLLPGEGLVELLKQYGITHITLPPSALAVMPPAELTALETIIVAGEACPEGVIKQWSTERRFFNAYGPTEATVCATVAEYRDGNSKLSIGRPLPNVQIYILDPHGQPVPIGVWGEMYIGGCGVTQGYLHRLELTAEKFLPHPFSQEKGTRLYKTGDLVRYLPDGNIEYSGRIDNQVKVRGFRIELGEIEAVLSQYPRISQVAVTVYEDFHGNKRIVAYLVGHKGQESANVGDLRGFLKEKLPEYMLPSAFVFLESLPLTPNGKIDFSVLPTPETRPQLEGSCVAPTTAEEKILTAIWSDVLGVPEVGIEDNFFELGGDSILSLKMVARANQVGLFLTPKMVLAHQTIVELARVALTKPKKILAEQGLVTGKMPLTPIQHWFFEQNVPAPHHYNESVMLSVPSNLQPELLEAALQQLILHHDGLRSEFFPSDGGWQVFNAGAEKTVSLKVVDLSTIELEAQQTVRESVANELQASFHLGEQPLVRAAWFDLGSARAGRLLLIVHHLVVDAVSWRILLADLVNSYQQLSQGQKIQLPPKTSSFRDWAERLSEYGRTSALESELDYWLTDSHIPPTPIPVDYPWHPGANTIDSTDMVSISLSPEQTRILLQDVPPVYNTQINDVLLSALGQSFAQWTGENSLLINLEGHGREDILPDIDLSRTVGWFTSLFPVHLQLPSTDHPGHILKSIKEQIRRIPHHGIGYGVLRYLCQNHKLLKVSFPSQVSFNYLGQFTQQLLPDTQWELVPESGGADHNSQECRRHLLEVNGLVVNDQLQMNWTYSQNIHRRCTIEALAQNFLATLEALIAHCCSPNVGGYTPSDFPDADLSQEELDQLVLEI